MDADDDQVAVIEARNVALVYDIHGNHAALEAVLEDLEGRGVDLVVFGGDYALNGPHPAASVEGIRQTEFPAIRGNTDEYLVSEDPEDCDNPVVAWTRGMLDEEQLEWLRARPFALRVAAPGRSDVPDEHMLVVHATPTDIEGRLLVEQHPYKDWPLTEDEEAQAMLGDARADLTVFGHIHSASAGIVGGRRVRSVGSVGFPWDGDRRAAYGLARWNGDGWVVQDLRVKYDWEAVVDEIETSDTPRAEDRAASIRDASLKPLAPEGAEEDGEQEDGEQEDGEQEDG